MEEGCRIILKRDKCLRAATLGTKSKANLDNSLWVHLNGALGHPYGTTFTVDRGQLIPKKVVPHAASTDSPEASGATDNRNLSDAQTNQKLTAEDISRLRAEGKAGDDIVKQLVEGSSTFQAKTEFSQQKYLKKKKRRHIPEVRALRPTARLVCEMYSSRKQAKHTMPIRVDSLAQLLSHGNVMASSRVLAADSCHGVLVAALLERLAGHGTVVQFYPGGQPNNPAVEMLDLADHHQSSLVTFPMTKVKPLLVDYSESEEKYSPTEEAPAVKAERGEAEGEAAKTPVKEEVMETDEPVEKHLKLDDIKQECDTSAKAEETPEQRKFRIRTLKRQQLQEKAAMIRKGDFDGLLVATLSHPLPLLKALLPFLAPSRQIVVYHPYIEVLEETFLELKMLSVVNLHLMETWYRHYQVLPDRTHPEINMSGTGGYLLTGTTVKL